MRSHKSSALQVAIFVALLAATYFVFELRYVWYLDSNEWVKIHLIFGSLILIAIVAQAYSKSPTLSVAILTLSLTFPTILPGGQYAQLELPFVLVVFVLAIAFWYSMQTLRKHFGQGNPRSK